MNQFITKGTISGFLGVIAMWAGFSGHAQIAAMLKNPDTVQNIIGMIGSALALYAGFAEGVAPKAIPVPTSPPTPEDPYPGYDFDPVRGWVKTGGA